MRKCTASKFHKVCLQCYGLHSVEIFSHPEQCFCCSWYISQTVPKISQFYYKNKKYSKNMFFDFENITHPEISGCVKNMWWCRLLITQNHWVHSWHHLDDRSSQARRTTNTSKRSDLSIVHRLSSVHSLMLNGVHLKAKTLVKSDSACNFTILGTFEVFSRWHLSG